MAGTDGGFDDAVRKGDPDRWLASRFISDPARRQAVLVLYAFDLELARAPHVTSSPMTADIRLAWWDEALDEIFAGGPFRAHPVVQALASVVAAHGLQKAPLETMIGARREALFTPVADSSAALSWADEVAGAAAALAARILDPAVPEAPVRLAGQVTGLAILARSGINFEGTAELLAEIREAANRAIKAISPAAFPAVAAGALARHAAASELARRLRLTWAVARGRL
jgi:phytoene synthase